MTIKEKVANFFNKTDKKAVAKNTKTDAENENKLLAEGLNQLFAQNLGLDDYVVSAQEENVIRAWIDREYPLFLSLGKSGPTRQDSNDCDRRVEVILLRRLSRPEETGMFFPVTPGGKHSVVLNYVDKKGNDTASYAFDREGLVVGFGTSVKDLGVVAETGKEKE